MKIINVSIDLNRIDKSKIKNHTNGAKYYAMTLLINDEPDQYGNDVAVIDTQSKEEREAKEKRNYLGNGKTVYNK